MNIILVTDIFGKTPALIKLGEELDVNIIVDPYDGINMGFKDEAEAYSYFIEHVGFDKYFYELQNVVTTNTMDSTLIGFSIGASAIWKLSDNSSLKNVSCGICYYGSQIRNYKKVSPSFKVDLIFPKKEHHFDVQELKAELSKKRNVRIIQTGYLHGFMNLYSTNYDQSAYVGQLSWLRENVN